ncbi:hypothetical protein PUNSTDRAFT_58615 [Punctularia strigosozonata HHB-11173 SS5]|uniref:uncharacterized protein n=1 Tax=Punctularia strigosozonata (strain HHB-11173) TaxID=741275 RepID=UPI00044174C7|nr:uncharacterized protein PUNSTDRAFT_58615 [Punctularia strigosozonata HHB-11173 SS5]EIN14429.1 hypothetical protein PUNSTDRAFT_58615 [Punctularia strigosozonata HHB-11173 SS5]
MGGVTKLTREGWFFVGLASSFPDTTPGDLPLCEPRSSARGCKVFRVSRQPYGEVVQFDVSPETSADGLRDQVLVFKYKGKMYAVDQQCPHSSYPLSNGSVFDIEDFGLALSAGITCPKHSWSFDLVTGMADRGNYRLKIWEVQYRDPVEVDVSTTTDHGGMDADQEIWVRRKPRIG